MIKTVAIFKHLIIKIQRHKLLAVNYPYFVNYSNYNQLFIEFVLKNHQINTNIFHFPLKSSHNRPQSLKFRRFLKKTPLFMIFI